MDLSTYFTDFLQAIRPTDEQRSALKNGHTLLRGRLNEYEPLKAAIVTTFLQGSYRRSTALRPAPKQRSDVDIVVVTRLHEVEYTPAEALDLFKPFMEKYYSGTYRMQGRSIGVSQKRVDMDLVVTSAPPESIMGILPADGDADQSIEDESRSAQIRKAAETVAWKTAALRIPNRDAMMWEDTHPLLQLDWTREKNAATNGHFVNVVKALKWWRYAQHPDSGSPRSYPLERIIAECCPDGICNVAEGVTRTLEAIVDHYRSGKPVLAAHGASADVLRRVSDAEFHQFYQLATGAARLARRAFSVEEDVDECARLWHELFGDAFPEPPRNEGDDGPKGGFTPRDGYSNPGRERFA